MAKRTFISLLTSFSAGFFGGFLCTGLFTAICCALFNNNDFDGFELAFTFIGIGVFVNGIICFLLCILIYLPICIFDKKHITNSSFRELLTRYTPIVIIPLSIIYFCMYLLFQHDMDKDMLRIFLLSTLSAFSVSYISLIVFTKVIKSGIREINS
jgi:hypothetical protein